MFYYVNKIQTIWDYLVYLLVYDSDFELHQKISNTSFSPKLSREPPRPVDVMRWITVRERDNDTLLSRQLSSRVLSKLRFIIAKADKRAQRASVTYKRYSDRRPSRETGPSSRLVTGCILAAPLT